MGMIRTSKRRLPWWMYIGGLSYIFSFGFTLYLIFWGPAELGGFVQAFSEGAMVVRSVEEDSTVAKGGLRAGDRVLMIDGRPIRTAWDWNEATGNFQVGRREQWLVARGDDHRILEIVPEPSSVQSRFAEGYLQYLSLLLPGFFVGLLIAWKRPTDAVGRIGAWFAITVSIAFGFPVGWAPVWRALPNGLQLLLWIPQLSRFVLEAIFLSFFVVFPRRLNTGRWVWFAIWAPVAATLFWRVKAFYGVIHPGQIAPVPGWILQAGSVRTLIYLLVGLVVVTVNYHRFPDADEKRRVRVLLLGTGISMASVAVTVLFLAFLGNRYKSIGLWLVVPMNSAAEISLGYAILRHRVLDISVIIRQGLQYALARGAVIGVLPALGALFILDLTVNSQERLADVFRSRGWMYSGAAAIAGLAYWKRQEWLNAIDRRFFRERYNAQQVLRDVVGEIRSAGDFRRTAARVVERIETALHPEFVAVMVHSPGEPAYQTAAAFPPVQTPLNLAAESKLIGLLRVLGKPLESLCTGSIWLDQRLPAEESASVRQARIDVLVPISLDRGPTEALIALGVKRSEEPYTREDQELLETIASSLALLLDQAVRTAERRPVSFRECPECGACYEPTITACAVDRTVLIPMRVSRALTGRYRLERRRGQGGMGTVYEATDTLLGRRVAVKLIRDDWIDSVEAVQRFHHEARAAAGFTHPNVVTIYDYGVEAETRAFLVMELLEGEPLRDELRRHKRLRPARLVEILRGVCAAIEAAHQRALIHRDLKPENVFIARGADGTEVIKVLDFGLAKFLPSTSDSALTRNTMATRTGILIGTPAYMSPEQLLGGELDVGWDLWALAVVGYEALTGALPFAQTPQGDWRRAVLAGNYTRLTEYFDDPPDSWQRFFAHCFADRDQRPGTAAEFFGQLEGAFL
jgi:tRNA A-37 threonylcarbamoyl transferase component Bud32